MKILPSLVNKIRVDIAMHRIANYGQLCSILQRTDLIGKGGLFPSLKPTDRVSILAFNDMMKLLPELEEKRSLNVESLGKKIHAKHKLDSLNWLPERSPFQTTELYPAQLKTAKDIAYRLFIDNIRAELLRAKAGSGKTFIYGQILRWLKDKSYFKQCYAPWKSLVITKSANETLIQQTEHVLRDYFGLNVPRDVLVLSFDALRSSKGLQRMIKVTEKHEGGDLVEIFEWIPELTPPIVIIDECQAARHRETKCSKIIRALAEVEDVKVIFSSATPFVTVVEAEYLVVNMHLDI